MIDAAPTTLAGHHPGMASAGTAQLSPPLSLPQALCFNCPAMIRINSRISIPDEELVFSYVRASGPGGQNVNKVATAVQLRFDVRRSASLPEDVRRRLGIIAGRKMTSRGILVLDGRRFRTQEQNRADALARLRDLVSRAAAAPKRRKSTRPTKGAIERRLAGKRRRSERKMQRRKSRSNEE
ncbi:MAG: aminoacyl-tRNA hydrolase [Anaerolineales bacterium]|nr:aminoacyl-tRNA hydrolase [Anaerolineales bacterium]